MDTTTRFINVLKEIQPRQKAWSEKNFPFNSYIEPLLGITEECGEFAQAIIDKNQAEIEDAISDIMIYVIDFSNRYDLDLSSLIILPSRSSNYSTYLLKHLGKLNHHVLKTRQKIRGSAEEHKVGVERHLGSLISFLQGYSQENGGDLPTELLRVWEKVEARDWTKKTT